MHMNIIFFMIPALALSCRINHNRRVIKKGRQRSPAKDIRRYCKGITHTPLQQQKILPSQSDYTIIFGFVQEWERDSVCVFIFGTYRV